MEHLAEMKVQDFDIEIITDTDDIDKIRETWNKFNMHPNSDVDFYLHLQSIRSDFVKPYVFIFKENGIPVAMAVGRIESTMPPFKIGYLTVYKPRVRVLNIIVGGMMGDLDDERSTTLIEQLIRALDNKEADVAIFKHIPVESMLMKKVKKMPGIFRRGYLSELSLHRSAKLPGTVDGFLSRFSHKHRNTLKRNEKRLRKNYPDGVKFRIFKDESEVSQLCEDAENIAKLTYQRGIDSGFRYDEEHFERLSLAAKRGWLRAYLLYVDDKPCAFWIGTLYKDVFHSDFIGYDASFQRYSPGMIIFLKIVEDLGETGVNLFDFGLGDAGYKKRFADTFWEEANGYIYAPTFRGMKINLIRTLVNMANIISRKVLSSEQMLQKVKKKWRDLMRPTE
jgi:hypothetical protein